MKLVTSVQLAALYVSLVGAIDTQKDSFAQDDQKFWLRVLQGDSLSFPTKSPVPAPVVQPANCVINTSLECKASDGTTNCSDLGPVDGKCAYNSNLNFVQFQLTVGRKCEPSGNSQESLCLDCANVTSSGEFRVLCKNGATGEDLIISPENLSDGQIFTVTPPVSGGELPDTIDCIYVEGEKKKIQQNIIETSGLASLNLKDKFGAFTVISCDYGTPESSSTKTCLETISYAIIIRNEGSVTFDIQLLDFTLDDGFMESIIDELGSASVAPGETTNVTYLRNIDRCISQQVCANVDVKAAPTNGNDRLCEDNSNLCFETFQYPPYPKPVSIPAETPNKSPVLPTIPITRSFPVASPVKSNSGTGRK